MKWLTRADYDRILGAESEVSWADIVRLFKEVEALRGMVIRMADGGYPVDDVKAAVEEWANDKAREG